MKDIKLYTQRIKMEFDSNGVSILELDKISEEISKHYDIIDMIPIVSIYENHQYITYKVADKKASINIGFNFGAKK